MPTLIVIGSSSPLKLTAARNACRSACIVADVIPFATSSGVPAQPVGREETLRGARNRALAARDAVTADLAFGIENGLVREGPRWYDLAAVVVIDGCGRETIRWSEPIEIPDEFVARAEAAGFDRITVGAVIAEVRGSSPDDPHAVLTGGMRTRAGIIADALVRALIEAMGAEPSKGGSVMESVHRIEIGGVVRDLPVREVAPGIRVALFNILGDWELTEAAGKALAGLIPAGVDALVMPDGKATALLHVMGRESGLETFVARKEKKPYMAEPVRKAVYRSITTDREQALWLGADDAARLAGKRVLIVDDVISTGGTIEAMTSLMAAVGADVVAVTAVFTEGGPRPRVISLGDLPLF